MLPKKTLTPFRWPQHSGVIVVALAIWIGVFLSISVCADEVADTEKFFEGRIRPLLSSQCFQCHGPDKQEAGLRLDSRPALLQGADDGAVVVPGQIDPSRLLLAVSRRGTISMPPDTPLSASDVEAFTEWVQSGLAWTGPGRDKVAAVDQPVDMTTRFDMAKREHWAFTKPVRHQPPVLPQSIDHSWEASLIDRFIAGRLSQQQLLPSPQASPQWLIRRLYFDLTGLPPSAQEVDLFVANPSDTAYQELVDRLLSSREHAEHWARKWLDLARYADTKGYAFDAEDRRFPFSWTYRDWVIESFRKDLPYNRFVTLQIAADSVEPKVEQSDLAALGFLTVGRTFLGNVNDIIDDRIDLVTRGLMGLSIACARCHDHKYEPIRTEDYYALHGIFASCDIPADLPQIGPAAPGPEGEAFSIKLAELKKLVADQEQIVHTRAVRDAVSHTADYLMHQARPSPRGVDGRLPQIADGYELEQLLVDRLGRTITAAVPEHPVLGPWVQLSQLDDAAIPAAIQRMIELWSMPLASSATPVAVVGSENLQTQPAQKNSSHRLNRLVQEAFLADPGKVHSLKDVAGLYAGLVAMVAPDAAPLASHNLDGKEGDREELKTLLGVEGSPLIVKREEAMRVADRAEQTEHRKRKTAIQQHAIEAPGGPPHAMVLSDRDAPGDSHVFLRGDPGRHGMVVQRRMPEILGSTPASRTSSGRLELAHMVTSPENPLTARVLVNWVWLHHIGSGLISTPGDLGLRGEPPLHPELLDDLATRFVEDGKWSLRWLHREIVNSRTWQQSSSQRDDLKTADPENKLFARANRRRLEWEAWRDSLLRAGGSLDVSLHGGRGRNLTDPGVSSIRSVYLRLDRQNVPGIQRTFDIANPDTAVHVRSRTITPQRSLAVLNSPLMIETARNVATRSAQESDTTTESSNDSKDIRRIRAIWRNVLSRSPDSDELLMAVGWIAEEENSILGEQHLPEGQTAFGVWERLAQAVLATAEFQFID